MLGMAAMEEMVADAAVTGVKAGSVRRPVVMVAKEATPTPTVRGVLVMEEMEATPRGRTARRGMVETGGMGRAKVKVVTAERVMDGEGRGRMARMVDGSVSSLGSERFSGSMSSWRLPWSCVLRLTRM